MSSPFTINNKNNDTNINDNNINNNINNNKSNSNNRLNYYLIIFIIAIVIILFFMYCNGHMSNLFNNYKGLSNNNNILKQKIQLFNEMQEKLLNKKK